MLSKNEIKYIRSLHSKKFRQKYNNFIVEGDKMALEIVRQNKLEIEYIYALSTWIETNKKDLKVHFTKTKEIKEKDLSKISNLKTPNKVIVIVKQPNEQINVPIANVNISLFLDEIQDPGNMGTILRTADWFGIPYVFYSKGCVDVYNTKVIQASMGAFLRVKMIKITAEDLKTKFPQLTFYGTVLDGENIFKSNLTSNGIIVIGNEGRGISTDVLNLLDRKLKIPAPNNTGAESLNAGVAVGVVCAVFRMKESLT